MVFPRFEPSFFQLSTIVKQLKDASMATVSQILAHSRVLAGLDSNSPMMTNSPAVVIINNLIGQNYIYIYIYICYMVAIIWILDCLLTDTYILYGGQCVFFVEKSFST